MHFLRVFFIVIIGVLLGGCSLYIALKLGFVFGVSMLTVIFLKGFDSLRYVIPKWKALSTMDYGYYLAFTTGMSFSTITLISTVLAALLLNRTLPQNIYLLVLWVILLNVCGTFLAWSFKSLLEDVPFPTACATAALVKNSQEQGAQTSFWWTFGGASIWTLLRNGVDWVPQEFSRLSTSPLFVGLGGLLGFETSCAFFLGGFFFFGPQSSLLEGRLNPSWFAVSGIIVFVLTDFLFPLLTRAASFRWKPGFRDICIWLGVYLVSIVILGMCFKMNALAMMLTFLLVWPFAFLASKVTGETDVTPLGALGKLVILVFAWIPGSEVLMGLAGQVIGPSAASADFSSDLKCGRLLNCDLKTQLKYQVAGAVLGPIVFIPVFFFLGDLIGTATFPVPAAVIWNQFIAMIHSNWESLSPVLQTSLLSGSMLGFLYWAMKKWVLRSLPSLVPFCVSFFLDFATTNAIFLGGCLSFIMKKRWEQEKGIQVWCGLLSGEAILMVILFFL